MKYMNLYNAIQNPLESNEVLEKLIEAYSEGSSFYSSLTNRYSKHKQNRYSIAASDTLHASIFNRWKKEMLSITPEQYEKAIKDGLYKRNIFKLINLLKRTPDVNTKKEADEILNKVYSDKELEDAMESYRWDSIGLYSGWTHISERHINGKKTVTPNIEHRLYINTDLMNVHTMSKLFMDKCIAKKLPFYFKIGEYDRRDDNIVIYSDTKLLPEYLMILKEIEKEHPVLVAQCGKPPILSGVINNWIGYGSEPLKQSGEESFNGIRAKSIESAIEQEVLNWYRNNRTRTVMYNNREISLTDYIARQVAITKAKRMLEYRQKNPQSTYIKYTEADVKSLDFVKRIYNLVNAQISKAFNDYISGNKLSVKIEVPVKQDVTTTLYSSDIINEFKKFVSLIAKNDPDFVERVKARIKQDAIKQGIDPNKYCFDLENVELFRTADKEQESSTTRKSPPSPTRNSQQSRPTQKPTDNTVYHRPAGTPTHYKPMTDAEILESQRKLAEVPMVKAKRK